MVFTMAKTPQKLAEVPFNTPNLEKFALLAPSRSMRSLLLLLLLASVAAFKPECSKPTLLTLRGGGIDNGGGNAAYRRPGHTYRAQGTGTGAVTTPFLGDLSNEQEQMSDAERVYVVQQFSQQTVQKAFLKRVYQPYPLL